MRVLIIEDNKNKFESIRDCIGKAVQSDGLEIGHVDNLSDAAMHIGQVEFDLIILDLMLPYYKEGTADSRAGLELLRQIRGKASPNATSQVVGLSAFPEELRDARTQFEQQGVMIVEYDADGAWKSPIERFALTAMQTAKSKQRLDFVILVALEEERAAYDNTEFKVGTTTAVSGLNTAFVQLGTSCGAVIKLRQMGLVAATLDTILAISTFRPRIVAMSGICAGLSEEVELGQLIIASPAWEYQAGKWAADGFKIAPYQIPLKPRTKLLIEQSISDAGTLASLEANLSFQGSRPGNPRAPEVLPACTGSAVIADKSRLVHIEQQHRKLAAIDMETYGVYYAAHEAAFQVDHFFSVKSVVDFADKDKADKLHSYGAAVAAKACIHLLKTLIDASV